jgi:hypothetical protein
MQQRADAEDDDSNWSDNVVIKGLFINPEVYANEVQNGKEAEEGLLVPVIQQLEKEHVEIEADLRSDGSLEMKFEIEDEIEQYEEFEFPEIGIGKYIHDFRVNYTAIIRLSVDARPGRPQGQCFVMPLNRDEVEPPKNFYDLFNKISRGEFNLDVERIRHETRVVLPPVTSPEELFNFGALIAFNCDDKITYRLEEVTRVARDAAASDEDAAFDFAEFTGKYIVQYHISNLADVIY